MRSEFHDKRGLTLNGVQIPKLFPGEKFGLQAAARPAAQFGSFEEACLRNIAAGVGLSYEQLSQDWSKTNYSSARAALLEVWRGFNRTRARFCEQFATPVFALWLEEAINRGDIKLPKGAPDFYAAKAAYCRVKWIGPARGWVDPTKEATAAQLRMDIGLSTLEDECSEQCKDWEEVLHQRKRELDLIDKLGLPRPAWADQLVLSAKGTQQVGAPPPDDGSDAGNGAADDNGKSGGDGNEDENPDDGDNSSNSNGGSKKNG
jgi:lambda family phage portal protein